MLQDFMSATQEANCSNRSVEKLSGAPLQRGIGAQEKDPMSEAHTITHHTGIAQSMPYQERAMRKRDSHIRDRESARSVLLRPR